MKRGLGLALVLLGSLVMGFGGYRALSALGGLYQRNLEDPLGQPEGSEQATSDQMLRGVMIGGVGVPVFLTGYVMWKLGARRSKPRT